jgi:hypothetical protein
VYAFSSCVDATCVAVPANTPGSVGGGGQTAGQLAEFTILEGSFVGGLGQFSIDVSYVLGAPVPVGQVTFRDRASGTQVKSSSIDTMTIAGSRATITGRATVDGVAGVRFVVEVEDLGKAGSKADTFRVATATGYAAFGVVERGNVMVSGGGLLP